MSALRILATILATAAALPASAAEMNFTLRNELQTPLRVKIYAADRGRAWPGGERTLLLHPGATQNYSLICSDGEQLCYGAWVDNDRSTFWGVGYDRQFECDDCCAVCTAGSSRWVVISPQ